MINRTIPVIITVCATLVALPAARSNDQLPFGKDATCMEGPLAQFGRYIGDWRIEDSQLAQDGSGWSEGNGARWIFTCLGNGTAIQDFWLPATGNTGTNVRRYNKETGKWEISWIADALPGLTVIEAEQDTSGNVVMKYVSPIPDPLRRITFFPPNDTGWDWVLEFSNDGGKTWFPVYKIHATPWQ
jgi:hypothetical protein